MKIVIVCLIYVLFLFVILTIPSCNVKVETNSEKRPSQMEHIDFNKGGLNPAAPPETEQFGRLVGIWDAAQIVRIRDGSWSKDTSRAEWRWYYILDGHAIQDDWYSLKMMGDSLHRDWIGTNIRIYNADEQRWHMAWIDKSYRRLATFTTVHERGDIIMTGKNARGRNTRNTFSDISEKSFNWTQEWTNDEGKNWFAVAKIRCRRKI